jgi:hypothetical protein
MGIGVGIFLIALGAILTFAVDWSIGGLDLDAVGWILMVVGVGGLILFFFWNQRRVPQTAATARQRQGTVQPRTYDDPTPPPPSTVTTHRTQSPPPATATMVMPQPPPATVTTVSATAPVVGPSQGRPEAG